MTTIAIDDKTIAADGMAVCGGEIVALDAIKMRWVPQRGVALAMVGAYALFDRLCDWYLTGAALRVLPPSEDDWCLVVAGGGRGVSRFIKALPYQDRMPDITAFGSGGAYAVGALANGASAKRAVEIAARFDPFTGGRVRVLCLMTGRLQESADIPGSKNL